tara:strand:- start:2390 stop:3496 length:1107 start_codon:yes stop_codon:yes gene_type:complete
VSDKIRFEYVWTDGYETPNLRSKVRYMTMTTNPTTASDVESWSFDGSSTQQAELTDSDLTLKPVRLYKDPFYTGEMRSFFVLCEVENSKGKPHVSNTRAELRKVAPAEDMGFEFGFEQEYLLINPKNRQPYNWPMGKNDDGDETVMFPAPQGRYYCGTGDFVKGRDFADEHAELCFSAGINIGGTNAEVLLSQWEYQIQHTNAVDACDDLMMARYIAEKLGEKYGVAINVVPKPFPGDDWNGSGCHINFSTPTFAAGKADSKYIDELLAEVAEDHSDHIRSYGEGNNDRLTGKNETPHIDDFEWGNGDRSVAIRIPSSGTHLEDRRPGANMNPYTAVKSLLKSLLNAEKNHGRQSASKRAKKKTATVA